MRLSLLSTLVLIAVASATPTLISECGTLSAPFTTYQLAKDIAVQDTTYGYVCFNIKGDGITLNGDGHELTSASNEMLHATGVRYSGTGSVVTNMRINNLRTGIHAKGRFGEVYNTTITHAVTGVDVTAINNRINNNIIGEFDTEETATGIYVSFPALEPVDSYINITNNVISDIQGDFALGVAVYYATSVVISNNYIYNLRGGISSQEISVISGKADSVNNAFHAPDAEGSYTQLFTVLASLFAVAASLALFRRSSSVTATPAPVDLQRPTPEMEEKKKMEAMDEKEKELMEKDGGLAKRTGISFHLGASGGLRMSTSSMM